MQPGLTMFSILHSRVPSFRALRKALSDDAGSDTPVICSTHSEAAFRLYAACAERALDPESGVFLNGR